jgi:hypothetical protein
MRCENRDGFPGSFACRLGSRTYWRILVVSCVQRARNAILCCDAPPVVCSEEKWFGEYRNEMFMCHRRDGERAGGVTATGDVKLRTSAR